MLPLQCTVLFASFIVLDSSAQTLSHVFVSLSLSLVITVITVITVIIAENITIF